MAVLVNRGASLCLVLIAHASEVSMCMSKPPEQGPQVPWCRSPLHVCTCHQPGATQCTAYNRCGAWCAGHRARRGWRGPPAADRRPARRRGRGFAGAAALQDAEPSRPGTAPGAAGGSSAGGRAAPARSPAGPRPPPHEGLLPGAAARRHRRAPIGGRGPAGRRAAAARPPALDPPAAPGAVPGLLGPTY